MNVGLELCRWAGRSQKVHKERLTYYIDGAHTTRSMQVSTRNQTQKNDHFSLSYVYINMSLYKLTFVLDSNLNNCSSTL